MTKDKLDKDKEIFSKDLSIILKSISESKKELVKLDNLIEKRYAEYAELSLKEKPLIDSLLARKEGLCSEISSLDKQIPGLKENIELLKIQAEQETSNMNKTRKTKAELEKEIEVLSILKSQLDSDIEHRTSTLSSINADIRAKEMDLVNLVEQCDRAMTSLETIEFEQEVKKRQNVKLDEDMLNKRGFIQGLEEWEAKLENREDLVELMEIRLTPEYKEFFGKFANLQNNDINASTRSGK